MRVDSADNFSVKCLEIWVADAAPTQSIHLSTYKCIDY